MKPTIYILLFILLSSYVYAEAVNWIRPDDLRDDLYGMLIYNGNINITFDGDFTLNSTGFDTNESTRFDNLISECSSGDFINNITGDGTPQCGTPTVTGDTNLSGGGTIDGNLIINSPYNLTIEGHLIIQNLTTSEDIRPNLNNIYSLGNSTRWFNKLYATDIHNSNFYGNFVNASEINTTDVNSDNVNSTTIQVDENITLAGYNIIEQDGNLAVVLT